MLNGPACSPNVSVFKASLNGNTQRSNLFGHQPSLTHTHIHIFLNQQTGTVYFLNQLDQSITVDKALNSFGVYLVVCFWLKPTRDLKKNSDI